MPHVGNDVVDLTNPAGIGKSRDIRFIRRVFTSAEKALIQGSANPDRMLWSLWAAKEAAYKAMRKSRPYVSSVPRSYYVVPWSREADSPLIGTVETPAGIAFARFFHEEKTVHAIAVTEHPVGFKEILWGVEATTDGRDRPMSAVDNPSYLVREALIRRLSQGPDYGDVDMEIRRIEDVRGLGPPKLFIDGKCSNKEDISLSHDGNFVAYACCWV